MRKPLNKIKFIITMQPKKARPLNVTFLSFEIRKDRKRQSKPDAKKTAPNYELVWMYRHGYARATYVNNLRNYFINLLVNVRKC